VDPDDVPSSVDFHDPAHARRWTEETVRSRPCRPSFFAAIATALHGSSLRVLELGAGPGHLARELLVRCEIVDYVALDFSLAMHELARAHLAELANRVTFVARDFRMRDWFTGLGTFDAVVTWQAVHETRHKRHALPLFVGVRPLVRPGGALVYGDHYFEAGKRAGLFLDRTEQPEVLCAAGFVDVTMLHDEDGMALYRAIAP
jgi:SAM-dependent methyltransferase